MGCECLWLRMHYKGQGSVCQAALCLTSCPRLPTFVTSVMLCQPWILSEAICLPLFIYMITSPDGNLVSGSRTLALTWIELGSVWFNGSGLSPPAASLRRQLGVEGVHRGSELAPWGRDWAVLTGARGRRHSAVCQQVTGTSGNSASWCSWGPR